MSRKTIFIQPDLRWNKSAGRPVINIIYCHKLSQMKKIGLVVLLLLLPVFYLSAQKVDSILSVLSGQYPSEKVYIHYDKEYYVAGETIWFKAYFYSDGKPSGMSSNFYLQFADSRGQLVSTKKYPVMGAVAKGSILIPDSLPQGNYYIRALTPGMLNEDEAMIYKKNIFVFRPAARNAVASKTSQTVSLKFFPESGNLVDGILTVTGFKAVDQLGTPVEVNGIIKTEEGTTIASFKSYHDGIGKVQFKPQAGKKYIAEVETDAGKRIYSLPEVIPSGINLKVQDEKGGKRFQLSRSDKDKGQFDNLLVIAEINNHIVYETEIAFENYPSVIGHLVTDSLPSGILHFTVFNKDGVPLAERLSFVDNGEYRSNAELVIEKAGMERRAENIMQVSFAEGIQRSCSVSVIDFSGQGFGDEDNIHSRFLLTGDLKGYVHNPGYYFAGQGDSARLALDNLMLTHGWSRYNWTKLLGGEYPSKKFKDVGLISLSGKIADEKTREPLTGGKLNIYLEGEDSTSQNFEVSPDAGGRFRLDSLAFLGKARLFYVYSDSKEKARPAVVILDENLLEKNITVIPANLAEYGISRNAGSIKNKEEVDNRFQYVKTRLEEVKELENVDVKSKTSKKPIDIVNEKYTSGVFRAEGKVNIDNINDPSGDKSMSVVDYVKNRVQQIEIQGGRFVNRKNISLMSGQKWLVGLFLNEQPTEMSLLRTIRVKDVALIKFYEAGFVGVGSGSPGGALAVYTTEKFGNETKPEKLEFVEYNGYSITKEFYSPDYGNKDVKYPATDKRTTLYWNPDVITDAETKSVKLNFYNNDFSRKFKVVVEGFDAAGKLIHLEKIVGN